MFLKVLALILFAFSTLLYAEADGPDYWQIRDVDKTDVLNMRSFPDFNAPKIGEIPHDATCIRNMGCRGGLTFNEFTTLSAAAKQQILKQRPRWCRVSYQGRVAWVAGRYLGEGVCQQQNSRASDSGVDVYNHRFSIEKETVRLRNGSAQFTIPGTTAVIITEIINQPVTGNINKSDDLETVVVLLQHTGGTGSFYYLAAALADEKIIESYFLGDRIKIVSVSIADKLITVDYLERSINQAMAVAPKIKKTKKFSLSANKLVLSP